MNSTFSELYHANGTNGAYDGLNRLTTMTRGTLSDANSDGVPDTVSTPNSLAGSGKTWTLDATGNWTSNTSAAGTNTASTQTRGFDSQNEITSLSGLGAVATPTFDSAGNTTKDGGKTKGDGNH